MTATTSPPQRITWADDDPPPHGRYLLDRSRLLGPRQLFPAGK
jgi:hypothetical protein